MKLRILFLLFLLRFSSSAQTDQNNWYVLLSSSKFYFNYRHTLNALFYYSFLKEQGVPDSRIILMLPDNYACNPRNPFPSEMLMDKKDYFPEDIEIDYRGADITVETILNLLRGRYPIGTPSNKRLDSNAESRIFIYMNGHGGQNFFKIQDTGVLQSEDLASAFNEMRAKNRYKQVLLFLDTCKAASIFDAIESEGLILVASSNHKEDAYSYKSDTELNILSTDYFSYYAHQFLVREKKRLENRTLSDLLDYTSPSRIRSTATVKSRVQNWRKRTLSEYFGEIETIKQKWKSVKVE